MYKLVGNGYNWDPWIRCIVAALGLSITGVSSSAYIEIWEKQKQLLRIHPFGKRTLAMYYDAYYPIENRVKSGWKYKNHSGNIYLTIYFIYGRI